MATPPDRGPTRSTRLSVQRRRRLARTIAVATVVVAAVAGVGYAVTRPDDRASPSSGAGASPSGSTTSTAPATTTTPAPSPTTPSPTAPTTTTPPTSSPATTPAPSLAPVVTDRIPSPTRSFALDAAVPGTTNMQPSAAAAWQRVVAAAANDDVTLTLRVGWRSEAWQRVLNGQARTDPTDERAGEWAVPADESPHVKGYAVDVTTRAAADWLEREGSAYGWCRTYVEEWWHVEYLATTTCPAKRSP